MTKLAKQELEGFELSSDIDDAIGVAQFTFYNPATKRVAFLELDLTARTYSACVERKGSNGKKWLPLDKRATDWLKSQLSDKHVSDAARMALLFRHPGEK